MTAKKRKIQIEINDLKTKYIAKIFEYVQIADVPILKLVCKKWLKAVETRYNYPIKIEIRENGVFQKPSRFFNPKSLRAIDLKILIMFKNIVSISFRNFPSDGEIFLENIINILKANCNNLEEVTFEGTMKAFDYTEILSTIVDHCPSLRRLISYDGLPQKYHSFMQQLKNRLELFLLRPCQDEFPSFKFKRLETFIYRGSAIEYQRVFKLTHGAIFKKHLINLRVPVPLNMEIVKFINLLGDLCPNLQYCELGLYEERNRESLSSILDAIALKFLNLSTLRLRGNIKQFETTIEANNLAVYNYISKSPQIRQLELGFSPKNLLFDGNLLEMLANISNCNLEILDIIGIDKITIDQLSFLKNLKQLRRVTIDNELICESEKDARRLARTICKCRYLEYFKVKKFYCPEGEKEIHREIIRDKIMNDMRKKYGFSCSLLR